MTKRKTILVVLMSAIMSLLLAFAVACGGGEKVAVKWNIGDHASVAVEGYKELPTEWEVGEDLNFTVKLDDGYEAIVNVGRTRLSPKNGVYTYQVKGETEITVTTNRIVSGVTITQKPTKNLYYAGEELDPTGMVVTVNYATGENEVTEVYTVNYQQPNATAFSLGDTYYTVSFGAKQSDHIDLDKKVVGLITVDPAGGEIEAAYESQLKMMPGIDNIAVDAETGAYTFTFENALTENIPLPTRAQLTRDDFNALGMRENGGSASNVPAETVVSHSYTAAWEGELVKLTSLKYEKKTVDGKEVPYLVFKGTYNAATKVQLVFGEGNQNVRFTFGDVHEGTKGDEFTFEYNMAELAVLDDGKYQGMWLDTQFVSIYEVGGKTYTDVQTIAMSDSYVDKTELNIENLHCSFSEYAGMLKTVVSQNDADVVMTYTIEGEVTDDAFNLVIKGTINQEYNGKKVVIDYWDGKTDSQEATIENGAFTIKFDLNKANLGTMVYFHFKLLRDSGEYKYNDDGNLPANEGTLKTVLADNGDHGELTGDSIKIENKIGSKTFYVGRPTWDALVAYGECEAYEYNKVSVEVVEDTPYYVVSGTYAEKEELTKEKITELLKDEWKNGDISNNPDAGSVNAEWTVAQFSKEGVMTVVIDETEHTFSLRFALPAGAGHGWMLFVHISANNNFMGNGCEIGEPVMVGTVEYAIKRGTGFDNDSSKQWIQNLPMLCITDTAKTQLSVASGSHVKLYVDDYANPTKVYYVVKVTHKNAELGSIYFGNADSGEYYAADAALTPNFQKATEEARTDELWFDVTAYTGSQLWPHLYYKEADGSYTHFVEIKDADTFVGEQYAVVGGRQYSIKNDSSVYSDVCLVTAEASADMKNPPKADKNYTQSTLNSNMLNILTKDNKVYLTVEGTAIAKYYSQNDVKLYLYNYEAGVRVPVTQTIEWKANAGSDANFTITADITGLEISVVKYSVRVYFGTFEDHYVNPSKAPDRTLDFEGKSYTITCPGNTAASISVSKFDGCKATSVAFDTSEDGKIKFVVSGLYENVDKSEVEEKFGESLKFDFETNDFLTHGGWNKANEVTKDSVEVTDDGTWKIVFDISSLTDAAYTVHFDGDNLSIVNASIDGLTAQFGNKTFKVSNKNGSTRARDFWGAIGILVEDPDRRDADFDPYAMTIETNAAGEPVLVLRGTANKVEESEFSFALEEYDTWAKPSISPEVVLNDDGTYTITVPIKDIPASANSYVFQFKIGGDDKLYGGDDGSFIMDEWAYGYVADALQVNGKYYSIEVVELWGQHRVQLLVQDAEKNLGIRISDVDVEAGEDGATAYLTMMINSIYTDLAEKLTCGDTGEGNYVTPVAKIETVKGGYKVYFDVTNAPMGVKIWTHLWYDGSTYNGTENGDVNWDADGRSVTVGGKTYSITNKEGGDNGGTWGVDVLMIQENNA